MANRSSGMLVPQANPSPLEGTGRDEGVSQTTTKLTQGQRSQAMIERLLTATLTCLGRDGYAKLSINQIVEEAGVSRGALFHHFSSKEDIAAAAMAHFMEQRYRHLADRFAENGDALSLERRLAIFREEFARDTAISLEISNTMRNEVALRDRMMQAFPPAAYDEQLAGYTAMFPEAGDTRQRQLVVSVLVAVLRGLAIEEMVSGQSVDEHFELFAAMFLSYFEKIPKEQKAR